LTDISRERGRELTPIKILLIQENPDYVERLAGNLSGQSGVPFEIKSAMSLGEALGLLPREKFDAILLELSLSDSSGIETFKAVQAYAPSSPVVILTHLDDEILALRAVREGAQDYLLKSDVDTKWLRRVVLYAIERQRMQMRLFSLSVMDDLTGLYNRRGFLLLAEHQMKLAHRAQKGLLLFLSDLDGLKKINDRYGHQQGDLAIKMAGEILRGTFRKSDIIARIGGDEFAVIAVEAGADSSRLLRDRLEAQLREFGERKRLPYPLALSTGIAHFDAKNAAFVEQLIAQADKNLYEQKKARQANNISPVSR
jgi:diguanylate cyclase (GGDEF)-like protein